MIDLEAERRHLAKAEHDIADGEMRVSRQILLIEELRRDGHDIAQAERYLGILRDTLATWYDHRDLIMHEIERHPSVSVRPPT